jgi:hypothetical protein
MQKPMGQRMTIQLHRRCLRALRTLLWHHLRAGRTTWKQVEYELIFLFEGKCRIYNSKVEYFVSLWPVCQQVVSDNLVATWWITASLQLVDKLATSTSLLRTRLVDELWDFDVCSLDCRILWILTRVSPCIPRHRRRHRDAGMVRMTMIRSCLKWLDCHCLRTTPAGHGNDCTVRATPCKRNHIIWGFSGAVRASDFHLWVREFDSHYGLMWKESVNALPKVVGFLRVLWFPPTGKVDRVG